MAKQTLNNGDTLLVQRTKINENITYVESLANDAQSDANDALSAANAAQGTANAAIPSSQRATANGVASLDGTGKVPSAQLPAYVDDVLEFANFAALPTTGETGKIYVTLDTNYEYRWSGSTYIRLVASPGSTDAVPEGTTNLYFSASRVLGAVLTGLSTATNAVITATDSILGALGKLQAQITGNTTAIATKVNKTDYAALTFGATVSWDTQNEQSPLAKVTATGDFSLNISNLKSGATATLKVITNTASVINMAVSGTGLTFKMFNTPFSTYTFPAATGKEYYLYFTNENGTVEVVINDYVLPSQGVTPSCKVRQTVATAAAQNAFIPMQFNNEVYDNAGIFDGATNVSNLIVPGTGAKLVVVGVEVTWPSTAASNRFYQLKLNATNLDETLHNMAIIPTSVNYHNVTLRVNCVGGDIIQVIIASSLATTYTGNVFMTVSNI